MAKKLLAVIDVETTGLNAATAEMLELTIMPVTDKLERHPKILPFKLNMCAEHPEWISAKAIEVNGLDPNDGVTQREGIEVFEAWRSSNKVGKIDAIGHYYHFDKSFLFMWLMREGFKYSDFFTPDFIDTKMIAKSINHKCLATGLEKKFPRLSLKKLAEVTGVSYEDAHGSERDCEITLAVLRAMLSI